MKQTNVLIIGGTGFIGGHLAEALAAEGCKVWLQDVSLGCWMEVQESCEDPVLLLDINEAEATVGFMDLMQIDVVYCLNGISHTVSSATGAAGAYRAGVFGLVKLLDAMRKRPLLVDRIIIASSSLISGILLSTQDRDDMGMGLIEDHEEDTVFAGETWVDTGASYHPYVSNKVAMEMAIRDHFVLTKQPYIIGRFGTAFGPRMRPGVVEHHFIKGALSPDKVIKVHGDGSQWRQCLYVKDICDGLVACAFGPLNLTAYLVPQWKTSILEMAQAMQKIDPEVRIEHVDERPIDIRVKYIDPKATEQSLNWKARTSFLDGMRETRHWHMKNPGWLR